MSADPTQPPPPPESTAPPPGQPAAQPPGGDGRSFWVIVAIVVAILVVAGVVAAVALTSSDDEPTTSGATVVTSVTAATGPTQATGPTATGSTGATGDTEPTSANLGCSAGAAAPDTLPDGEYFGFVKSVNTASQTMDFDLACFYTGDEANRQAAARGDEVPVPNDVYIVNDNTKIRTLSFDPAAELKLIDWNQCCEFAAGADMRSFASAVDSGREAEFGGFLYNGTLSPYWVTIQDGRVVKFEEQFLP